MFTFAIEVVWSAFFSHFKVIKINKFQTKNSKHASQNLKHSAFVCLVLNKILLIKFDLFQKNIGQMAFVKNLWMEAKCVHKPSKDNFSK